jgi:WD40 repeat protein/DNA-binding SARP family transcriptional activator
VVRRITLAGRITVQGDGAQLDERALPGRQPRVTFCLLVCERHRAVPRDELAENLWPVRRPATWEPALRGVVSRVRAFVVASGLGDATTLSADAGTYRLHPLPDVEVDLERAARQLEDGETALVAGDADRAANVLEQARSVFARPLLPGCDGPWLACRHRDVAALDLRCLEALARARLALGHTDHAVAAAEAAITRDPFRESAHRALMSALLAAGNRAAALRAFERCRTLLADELGADPAPATEELHLALLRGTAPLAVPGLPSEVSRRTGGTASSTGMEAAPDHAPYLGLRSFDLADASRFFGRSADVARLLDRLGDGRFLAVVGSSGSGKSSLVRAGLVAALRAGAIPGSDTWRTAVLRPGDRPLQALANALGELDPRAGPSAARLADDPSHLGAVLRAGNDPVAPTLLVVDQFEEVYTLCRDATHRQAFLVALTTTALTASVPARIVIVVRADFYHRLAEHPELADLAAANQVLVTPMDEVGMAEAIEGPARRAGLRLEVGLTETILRDVARRPGALPLLQHALLELWRRRADGVLTRAGYLASGGVAGALAQRAEATYGALEPAARAVARRVLLRLTQPGDGTEDTRRRVPFDELAGDASDRDEVTHVAAVLVDARLVTSDARADGRAELEVSHEALLRDWPRLRDWIEEDRAGLRVHRRVTAASAEWDRLGRDPGALYRGPHLAEAVAWAERDPAAVNAQERAFLDASVAAEHTQRHARVHRLRVAVASLAIGLAVATALSVVAVAQTGRLTVQRRASTAREWAATAVANLDVDPERSLLLALEAIELTHDADGTFVREAEEALHRALKRSRVVTSVPQGGSGLAVAPDGTWYITAGQDGTATRWDLDGREVRTFAGHTAPILDVALRLDGRQLATSDAAGLVRLWNVDGDGPPQVLRQFPLPVHALAFGPDGDLALGNEGGQVSRWDPATGELRWHDGHEDQVNDLAFSPDGRHLASASEDRTGRVWDLRTGHVTVLKGHPWQVTGVVSHPDGDVVATSSIDGTARSWDLTTGRQLRTFASISPVEVVAYTPDGARLIGAGTDGTARVWDSETAEPLLVLAGHTARIERVVAAPNGTEVLTASLDDTTRRWDISLGGGRDWLTAPIAYLRYAEVAFTPDGGRFVVPLDAGGVAVRDARTGVLLQQLLGHPAWVVGLTVSADGRFVLGTPGSGGIHAAPTGNEEAPIWALTTGRLHAVLKGHTGVVSAGLFATDGAHVLTGSHDGTVRRWLLADGRPVDTAHLGATIVGLTEDDGRWVAVTAAADGPVAVWREGEQRPALVLEGHTERVISVAFGPDGRLVTGSETEGRARVWDLATGELVATIPGHDAPMRQVAMSPDGSRVATAAEDGTVKLWDTTSADELLTLHGHRLIVHGVAFSPDGRLLASTSPDGTIALHLLPIDEVVALATTRVTRSLTEGECVRYLRLAGCAQTPTRQAEVTAGTGDAEASGDVEGRSSRIGVELGVAAT